MHSCLNQLHIFTVTKQSHIHYSLEVVLCLPFHGQNHVENILKHVILYVHDIKVMANEIGFLIRKLLENTSLYPIMGQIKTMKLLLLN